jgi:hypothetical protein
MAVPGVPTDLSAESTNATTIELRWLTPDDDGGSAITGYFIERNLNGAGFVTLVADTANTLVAFSDSTLSARDNAVYRVSAINGDGTGLPSDTDSATTATSEAQTIKELLFNNWSLTGELSNVVVGDMNQVVNFFDRGQIPGNKKAKAIVVQKINELGNENIVEHPKFFEQSDTFEVSCFLQVPTAADDVFSVWIDLMQQMTGEVVRILKTVYSPSSTTGEFFRTNTAWTKDDTFAPDDAMLGRTLRFTLTRIVATTEEVFLGYGGVLAFDTSESSGDSLPISDYIYTEVQRVQTVQGWRNIPYITTDSPGTIAIPIYYRGAFSGQFSCQMFLKKSDIELGTLNSLSQIFLPQSNGELGTAVFLQTNENTETIPSSLTESIPVNITSIDKISETEELVTIALRGNLTTSSTYNVIDVVEMTYEDLSLMEYEDNITMQYEN